jgi:hypothetical protein
VIVTCPIVTFGRSSASDFRESAIRDNNLAGEYGLVRRRRLAQ